MLGDFYVAQGQTDKAVNEFASLFKQHPKDLAVGRSYVQVLILANNVDEAKKVNDGILQGAPKDTEAARSFVVQILNHQGKSQAAVDVLGSAVKDAPGFAMAALSIGSCVCGAFQLWPGGGGMERSLGACVPAPLSPSGLSRQSCGAETENASLLTDASGALMPNRAKFA